MPIIHRNPNLPDYFVEVSGFRSILEEYEAGKVITLPTLRPVIDHAFWAGLDVEAYPALKKTGADADPRVLAGALKRAGVPADLANAIQSQAQSVLDQVLPVYNILFAGYAITRRKISWRLHETLNENMHVDAYKEPQPQHFARLFINLDNQPRIWKTSYPIEELHLRFGARALRIAGGDADGNEIQAALNRATFGPSSLVWWDNQPRHVIYFQPGECWSVDSRQVAHQIFYGRRAVSIDYLVDAQSMQDPRRQYLRRNEQWRDTQAAS